MELPVIALVCVLFFLVAFLYSSVGHGGASGYLAVMSFFAIAPKEMSTTALALNVLVAGLAFVTYYRAGFFSVPLTLPFLLASVPTSFVGGLIHVSADVYMFLLAIALLFAAVRLVVRFEKEQPEEHSELHTLNPFIALAAGAAIGLLSGIVGVGGGIFLSPLILLMRWATVKQTAAASAGFIVCNSIAGLLGRVVQSSFVGAGVLPFLVAAAMGGFLGARFGAKKASTMTLRRLLGVVLMIASAKLFIEVL